MPLTRAPHSFRRAHPCTLLQAALLALLTAHALAHAPWAGAATAWSRGARITAQSLRSMTWHERQSLAWACARSPSAAGARRGSRRPWHAGVALEGRRRLSGGQREAFERLMRAVLAAVMAGGRTGSRVGEGAARGGMRSVGRLGPGLREENGGGFRGRAGQGGDTRGTLYNVEQLCAALDATPLPATLHTLPVRGSVTTQQQQEGEVVKHAMGQGAGGGGEAARVALVELKAALAAASQQVLKEWSMTSVVPVCQWTGIVCATEVGHKDAANGTLISPTAVGGGAVRGSPLPPNPVVGVLLTGLGLQGTIASSLSSLPSLQYLVLSDNALSSSIPSSLALLPSLTLLDLSGNQLSGSIPSSLSRLSTLVSLVLSANQLSGTIPAALGALPSLRYLYLDDNALSSSIPSALGRLPFLSELALGTNALSGSLPASLSSLTSLFLLSLVRNRLSGPLPSPIFTAWCPAAFSIEVNNNSFSGPLPDFAPCTGLVLLDMGLNAFSGPVPASVRHMASLETLNLLKNSLSASLPLQLAMLPSLRQLDLSWNNLTGTIPPFCSSPTTTSLLSLRVTGNELSGTVPASMARCGQLQNLFLSDNRLSGSLPAAFTTLKSFRQIRLERNGLWGPLPVEQLENLTEIWLDGNSFSGPIPPRLTPPAQHLFITFSAPRNRFSGPLPPWLGQVVLLDVSFNNLSGPILPHFISPTANLSLLLLPGNRLSGCIPAQLTALTALKIVDLSGNQLEGGVPSNLGALSLLQQLSLGSNKLTGPIPADIAHLPALVHIDMSNNQLEGTIPPFVTDSAAARLGSRGVARVLVGGNALSGSIPESLSALTNLVALNLSANHLSGTLPSGLAALQQLSMLDASFNDLSGSIPPTLSSLSSLRSLNLSSNFLSGSIPAAPLASFPPASYANNSALCGLPTNVSCSSPPTSPLLAPDGSSSLPVAAVAGIVAGSVCVVAAVAAAVYVVGRRREEERRRLNGYLVLVKPPPVSLTVEAILAGTKHFSEDMLLGKGGFGSVYMCRVPGTQCTLAIKKLQLTSPPLLSASPSSLPLSKGGKGREGASGEEAAAAEQANREVAAEVRTLGQLEHGNLVRLYGAYVNAAAGERWLIYEYIAGGSLEDLLSRRGEVAAGEGFNKWEARVSVAMGLSKALKYLHHECSPYVIHRDIKPSNILVVMERGGAEGSQEGSSSEGSLVVSGSGTETASGSGGATSGSTSGNVMESECGVEKGKGANGRCDGDGVDSGGGSSGDCGMDESTSAIPSSMGTTTGNDPGTGAEAESGASDNSNRSAISTSALLRLFRSTYTQQPHSASASPSPSPSHQHRPDPSTPPPLSSASETPATATPVPSSHPSSLTLSSALLGGGQHSFSVRVADFGLARQVDVRASHMSTAVLGTYGYMAPEYAQRGRVTTATDVFAFGVVLLQLVSGRSPYDEEVEERGLARWAFSSPVSAVLDPLLGPTAPTTAVEAVLRLALRCTAEQSKRRPSMVDAWTYLTSLHDVVAHMEGQGGQGLELSLEQQGMAWDAVGTGSGSVTVLPGSRAERAQDKDDHGPHGGMDRTG